MQQLSIRFESNYGSCTGRSSENICSNSAQGPRVTIAVVQVGAVKIYVAVVEVLKKMER
jgi:hypothetical protein